MLGPMISDMMSASEISPCSRLVTLLLSLLGLVAFFGIHRLYAGKWVTGILQFVTLGFFGIWQLIDVIRISMGSFTDAQGRRITR